MLLHVERLKVGSQCSPSRATCRNLSGRQEVIRDHAALIESRRTAEVGGTGTE